MDINEYQYALDSKLVTVASGTAANTISETAFQPDSAYDEVVGVEAYEVADGGSAYYKLGMKDENGSYVKIAHKNAILSTAAVDQRGKMRPVNIPIRKDKDLTLQVTNGALLASDLKVEFVFTLRRKVTPTR